MSSETRHNSKTQSSTPAPSTSKYDDDDGVQMSASSDGEYSSIANEPPITWDGETVVEYTPASTLRQPIMLLKGIVADSLQSRELTWRLFQRNLRSLYRQTLLGLFWAFLPAVAQTGIWVFLNSNQVVRFETDVPYALYVLAGMLFWQGFIEAFQAPLQAIQSGKQMLSKINFPRESLLYVSLAQVAFNFTIRLSLLLVVMIFIPPEWSWGMLLAPLVAFGLLLFGVALGLLVTPVGSLYQDVGRFIAVAVPFWMFLTPVVYPQPESWPATIVIWANPVSPVLIAARDLALTGQTEFGWLAAIICVAAIPLALVGLIGYRLSMPILIERMSS